MTYQGYVTAAYSVFAIVMAWDFLAPRLQLRLQLRSARLRAARDAKRTDTTELSR
jgi:heme exporter protein D